MRTTHHASSSDIEFPPYDLYATLEISPDAEMADIKNAYNRLVLQYHPDKNTKHTQDDADKLKRIITAYKILSCYKQRYNYDTYRQHKKHASDSDITDFFWNFRPFGMFHNNFDKLFDDFFGNMGNMGNMSNMGSTSDFDFDNKNASHMSSFVRSNMYKKDDHGNTTIQEFAKTNVNGKKDKFFYKEVKDKNGNILEKEGEPISKKMVQYDINKSRHKAIKNK